MRLPTSRPPTHPGEILLEEFLVPLHMTQQELAGRIGVSYPRVNELVNAKRGVTPDTPSDWRGSLARLRSFG